MVAVSHCCFYTLPVHQVNRTECENCPKGGPLLTANIVARDATSAEQCSLNDEVISKCQYASTSEW